MSIHIKPENKGKFTALKKRTGHSATWFKQHGTPAQKKMATFALNAKKWKHADGGNLFTEDVNLFAYGAPIRDYGMEWNNKVDRLRAINSMISKIGQKADSIASGMDFGDMGSVSNIGSQGWGNTGNVPEGLTGNDIDASQSFAANEFGFACGGNLHKCGGNLHCGGGNLFDYGGDVPPTFLRDNTRISTGATYDQLKKMEEDHARESVNETLKEMASKFGKDSGIMTPEEKREMERRRRSAERAQKVQKFINKINEWLGPIVGQPEENYLDYPIDWDSLYPKKKSNKHAYGGDFSNGLTFYNNGGTHEENPNEGVQVGVDDQGTPNLVEEGEVRYQDYIFSNRLSLDEDMAKKYNIPKKYADSTFAYIAEKMGEESKEREYDPISQRGLKANMEKLRGAQEEVKAIKAQEEQMQQVQQIADELGVAPEDVIAAMQMQQEEAAQQQMMAQQQPSPEEMQMMQQQMPTEQVVPQEIPYALGGTLFDYAGMNFSNPQRTVATDASFPRTTAVNKFKDGGKTKRLLTSKKLSQAELWNKYTRKSLDKIVDKFEEEYNAAKTPEEKAELRRNFIQKFNAVQESYAKMYQDGIDPRVANEIVKQHQTDFDTFGGNTGYTGIEADLNMPGRTILKDTTDAKFTPDGYRQVITDTRNLGSNLYDPSMMEYYNALNERLHKSGINYELLDRDSMRYKFNGKRNELYGLSEYNPETVSEAEEEPRSIYDDVQMGDNTPTYTSYEAVGETPTNNSPTTSGNNPQSQEQRTGEQPKVYNTTPNYSMLDFVPLWQYLAAGKPDYYQADALVDYTNRMPKPTYKPIGDFVQYHPFDRQYAANQLRAQTAAAMRNNVNMSAGNRGYAGAMNLATNMQAQLADAAMQRQADEANLAQKFQAAQFNRGTNQFNAEAFNRLELQRPYQYQLGLQARAQRAHLHNAIDNAYNGAKSTNLNTFLNNMYNRKREAQDKAQLEWLTDRGVFGTGAETNPFLTQEDSFWNWLREGNWRKFNKNK